MKKCKVKEWKVPQCVFCEHRPVCFPPFKHSTPGIVYRMRGETLVRKGGTKQRKYVGFQ